MASTEGNEFPDFDSLISAAENSSGTGEFSGEGTSDKGSFDPDEYATIVQWYNEQSKHLQQHYGTHIEHQKQKLAEENEASFLEALQQSLQNYESDHLSDLANLSSSLDLMNDTFEKPSRLKELLLSPFSDNYSREINSPKHAGCHIKKYGNSSPCQNGSIKPHLGKKLKPFTELLKHMEAVDSKTKNSNVTCFKQVRTRLVSTEQYAKKYGSACDKNGSILTADDTATGKRVVLHPVKRGAKNNVHGYKTLTLSLKPCAAARKVVPNATYAGFPSSLSRDTKSTPTSPLASASTIVAAIPSKVNKRSCTPPDDHHSLLPQKRLYFSPATAGQSDDHDYCTANANLKEYASGIHLSVNESSEDQGKPAVQKVLKWQDYLRQLRVGVRSAPNSPTCSPKASQVSTLQSNNFMVVSLQGSRPHSPKYFQNTSAGKSKAKNALPVPKPLRQNLTRQTCDLEEFNTYMDVLQTNLKSSESLSSKPLPSDLATSLNVSCNGAKSSFLSKNASAMYSLAAMVRREQSKMNNASDVPKQLTTGTNLATKVVPSTQAPFGQNAGRLVGSSGQLLTIQVPISSNSVAARAAVKNAPKANVSTCPLHSPEYAPSLEVKRAAKSQQVATLAAEPAPTFKLMTSDSAGEESKSLILSGVNGKLKEILTLMAEQQAKSTADSEDGFSHDEQQLNTLQTLISCLGSPQENVKMSTSSANESTSFARQNTLNIASKCETTPLLLQSNDISTDSVQYLKALSVSNEVMAIETSQRSSARKRTSSNNHCEGGKFFLLDNETIENTFNVSDQKTDKVEFDEVSCAVRCSIDDCTEHFPQPDHITIAVKNNVKNELEDVEGLPGESSVTRRMAAAVMMASDVIDNGIEEMVYAKQIKEDSNKNSNKLRPEDKNSADIALEEALNSLEDDVDFGQSNSGPKSLSAADNLFCKLPSYFLTGKLVCEGKEENIEGLKKRGLKNVDCDPLISDKGKKMQGIEFDKLPHYLSSGKTRPNSLNCDGQATAVTQSATASNGVAVKLHPVGNNQHLTAQGTPVDTSETFYSRLPTYYTYGRPHLPVKTFNDDAADAKDDTVTSHTLQEEGHHSSKRTKHLKRKLKMQKKRLHKGKKEDKLDISPSPNEVLYSKLPSYYLSGRILSNHEKENSHRISPVRSPLVFSSSPRSLSYSSRSSRSRSRSPLHRPCSKRRYSSRSYSHSSARSASDSEDGSWRERRRSCRSRRERSYDHRSYDSSDQDHNEFTRHQERDARRVSKQHQDERERDRQRAMEERRVVYVGRIGRKDTKQELRRKFLRFGNIEAVSLHFRDDGDNFGFITFQYTCDAFRAIEEGRSCLGPGEPPYELCFGGRRQFCKTAYKDLDGKVAVSDSKTEELNDFDALLQQAKRRSIRQ